MQRSKGSAAVLLLGLAGLLGSGAGHAEDTMTPLADEAELEALIALWKARVDEQGQRIAFAPPPPPSPPAAPSAASGSAVTGEGGATTLDRAIVTGSRVATDDATSITNVQTVGVDEGDIVKHSGDYLLVLRRGRLFSARVGEDRLERVSQVDAYAPGTDPAGSWYDEMLVAGSHVVVIGYSYDRGGTEIGLFDLDAHGQLTYRATYHLRSGDYYSARNYASRLLGNTLVFYAPLEIDPYDPRVERFVPALRRWHRSTVPEDFVRLLPAQRIYRLAGELELDQEIALHTVTTCELGAEPLVCKATAVLGPAGRSFYVAREAVYVWTTPWEPVADNPNGSALYRMPLDGSAPAAIRTSGSPIDQMSFLERDGQINVLVGSEADGEGMWASSSHAGELALLRVDLERLGDGSAAAPADNYRRLPGLAPDAYDVHNRFIGDWLVYGAGGGSPPQAGRPAAWALRFADAQAQPEQLRLGHAVDRIDALGQHGLLVGASGSELHFTSVRLSSSAAPASIYIQPGATQGDDRTHGFFYRPDNVNQGIVGLPVLSFYQGGDPGAGVLYLRNDALRLRGIGRLDARVDTVTEDGCMASCVDWYGNARPVFLGERIFALLGYELVEGRLADGRVVERRRIDLAPRVAPTVTATSAEQTP